MDRSDKKVLQVLINSLPELKEKLDGISFSGQMHSLVLLDEQNQPIRNAILWNDVRTTEQCRFIQHVFGKQLLKKTKNLPLEGFTLPKLLWVKENEPENWRKAERFLLPKDYLAYWLTGNLQMERSDAAGTLLLNVGESSWDQEIVEKFGIKDSMLPELVWSTDCVGPMRKSLKEELDIRKEVKIFTGGADNACAALGAGIIKEDQAMCSVGTSGVFLSYEGSKNQEYQGKLHYFNHVIKDMYYSMGVTLAAGQSLTWYKNTFAKQQSFSSLLEGIKNSEVGSNGLLFTPYIMGERTPHVDGQIRGSFIGIDASHTLDDFTRSVIEGITFSLKDSQELMKLVAGKEFTEIISVGGGAKNEEWLQIQADIFQAKIRTLKTEQGPGLGAAMIAALGLKWFDSVETCVDVFVEYGKEYLPDEKNSEFYQKVYEIYQKIYDHTKDISHDIVSIYSSK